MRILAGDIGGTNTRLSIWERPEALAGTSPRQVGEIVKFKNANFDSVDAILDAYLKQVPTALTDDGGFTDACLGVAGPVDGRSVKLTNIPHWPTISADAIATKLQIPGRERSSLINDMPAHGASLASIEAIASDHVITIHPGEARAAGMRAIVMPGTGLGVGMLVWENIAKLHRPLPTEAGHMDLPVRDDETAKLIASMRKLHPNETISREHVIAGPGTRAIYACLKNPDAPDLSAAPKPEEISKLEAADPIAKKTLDVFAKLLGELCGNVALGCLATGGVYLAGNIATSMRSRIASPLFTNAFASTGPASMRQLIASVPVKLVIYEETGLLGAATYASWVAEGRV